MDSRDPPYDCDDTSFKKYPRNKYYDYQDLTYHGRNVFGGKGDKVHSKTIDPSTSYAARQRKASSKSKKKGGKPSKKSLASTKAISTSDRRTKASHHNSTLLDQGKLQSKEQLADELRHYQVLCLKLRRQNETLKGQLSDTRRKNKENVLDLQQKINDLNEKSIELRERSVRQEANRLTREAPQKRKKSSKFKTSEGEFKRFFLQFMDQACKIDERLMKRVLGERSLQRKLVMGKQLMREGGEWMRDKKYKFKCVLD